MTENWKDIKGFEDYFQVSDLGRIKSKDRYVRVCGGGKRLVKSKILAPVKCKNGYLEAQISLNGKRHIFLLHRLVAMHFIENPNNLPEVNHKNENIEDCRVENLEWCTSKYNANYGTRNERCAEKQRKVVNQLDQDGSFIKQWVGISNVEKELGIPAECIIRCCKGIYKTSGGYKWEYAV